MTVALPTGGSVLIGGTAKGRIKDGDITRFSIGKGDDDSETIFLVAFDEPGILEGEPVVPTLIQFHSQVEGLVKVFVTAFPKLSA